MNKRKYLLLSFLSTLTLIVWGTGGLAIFAPESTQGSIAYSGLAAGDVTTNSAILWTRTEDAKTKEGIVTNLTAQLSKNPNFKPIYHSFKGVTEPNRDYTLKLDATGLSSNTRYYYRFISPNGFSTQIGRFKTAPTKTDKVAVKFGFSGDADGKWRPYSSTQIIPELNLDYFIFLGDTMYETKSKLSPATADPFANSTQALADYRRKYRENLEPVTPGGLSSLQRLYASQGNYTLLDNHELGNKQFINGGAPAGTPLGKGVDATKVDYDVNKTGTFINKTEGFKTLLQAYKDYQPVREKIISSSNNSRTDKTEQLYFSQQWGANSIFINVDARSYRDIRLKTASGADDTGIRADNPKRTMLGTTQLKWLKDTLKNAQLSGINWKIIAVSSPIDMGGEDNGKTWIGGYRAERNELLQFIADNRINNVVFLSTDDHQNRVNELTYLTKPNDPASMTRVPNTFTIVAGPIGASGPDNITDHSFSNIKLLADQLVVEQKRKGIEPLGLDANFPGLQKVFREGDTNADNLRQPVDFYSPDTFNYATLDISADGKTLAVNIYGINSYAADTFPSEEEAGSVRRILGFEIQSMGA
jgi:phosphodiesterase/alkaline phosphatase D-like protein